MLCTFSVAAQTQWHNLSRRQFRKVDEETFKAVSIAIGIAIIDGHACANSL